VAENHQRWLWSANSANYPAFLRRIGIFRVENEGLASCHGRSLWHGSCHYQSREFSMHMDAL